MVVPEAVSLLNNSVTDFSTLPAEVYKPSWHQLIILGNGFDLECGLKSRFVDFFESRKLELEKWMNCRSDEHARNIEKIMNNKLTVWDLILLHSSKDNWCDIEAEIAAWVLNEADKSGAGNLDHTLGKIQERDLIPKQNALPCIDYPQTDHTFPSTDIDVADYFLVAHSELQKTNYEKSDLLNFLMSELHKLEKQFAEHLSKKVSDEDYQSKCDELFLKIFNDGLPAVKDVELAYSVLDFNYTRPFWRARVPVEDGLIVNIHGQLENEIIFGIDGKDHMNEPLITPFTKTYRLMSAAEKPIEGLVWTSCTNLDSATDVIKFYGHSLSEPDYSYFQAIFDGVNLYGGFTQLIFYSRPRKIDGELVQTEEDARREMEDKVVNLMNTYGKTLENKDHGKNLLHKLLLEGRLTVCGI